ncbi:MAG: nicotinate-nucleotide--dimethylbenzimidazole phosphoribosyltransferase, partial [Desulfobulbaceae bacterium]|nr:nicotinate-nucleotide--dimethylbenzimidazole phosphoribosyltransferase [Desulfobulbaceae bacterium]
MYEQDDDAAPVPEGYVRLSVRYCAICRTDAKMWQQGHRDLALPRVPGHEIGAVDETTGTLYTIWPGQSCGTCRYCRNNRENLCDEMKIIGFHSDGGFADRIVVPNSSLIPVEQDIAPHLLCFAEPVGCVLNALSAAAIQPGETIIIYGGGVVGMIAALVCLDLGTTPLVIENNEEKIARLQRFSTETRIKICKDTRKSDFDLAINTCDSPMALGLCITKLCKGGRLCYFSGLQKNSEMDTNLLNLIHYKELQVFGSYGPRKEHMSMALPFIARQNTKLSLLIEKIIAPEDAPGLMDDVLSARPLKYIIDCSGTTKPARIPSAHEEISMKIKQPRQSLSSSLDTLLAATQPPEETILPSATRKIDFKTKPLGALGKIERLAVQLSVIQNSLNPAVDKKQMFVFAGDHGVTEEGVSAFPSSVTEQMVKNFLSGGAAINVFCLQYDIDLAVVDMGVKADLPDHPLLIKQKVRKGTRNFAVERAMTREETLQAIENGAQTFLEMEAEKGCDLVGMGEMGIGNTTSASAIISCATGLPVADVSGRGTGIDDKGLERKIEVIEKALAFHKPNPEDGL